MLQEKGGHGAYGQEEIYVKFSHLRWALGYPGTLQCKISWNYLIGWL